MKLPSPAPRAIPPWAKLARESLGEYYLAINPNYKYVPYQQEMLVPALEGLERNDYDRLMVLMPSRHAKSDICTKAFIPWFISRHPGKNVILLSHTQPLANDFGSHIRNLMTRDVHHRRIFPELTIDTSSHAKDFFRTNRGNAFYAFGINAGVPGRGGDLVVIDDPIAGWEDALSELIQHNLYETYKAVIKQRLQAGGRILLDMTRWAIRDIAARILEDEGAAWKVVVLPAQAPDPKCAGCNAHLIHDCQGPYLWEEHYGRTRYEEAKKDLFIWDSMWQQNPAPRLNLGFKEEWLRFYVPKLDREGRERHTEFRHDEQGNPTTVLSEPVDYDHIFKFNTYILVDPAMGKEAAHDRTCMLVLAAGPEGRWFLVDGVLDRLDPTERINHVIRLARQWKVKQVVYEEYALQADTHFLNIQLKAEGYHDLSVISVGRKAIAGVRGGRLAKDDRITTLTSDFRDSRIWLPKRLVRPCVDGSQIDIVEYFLSREFLPWAGEGSTSHDDMLDCLSRIHDPEFFPIFATRENEDEEYDNYAETGGSWETKF